MGVPTEQQDLMREAEEAREALRALVAEMAGQGPQRLVGAPTQE